VDKFVACLAISENYLFKNIVQYRTKTARKLAFHKLVRCT